MPEQQTLPPQTQDRQPGLEKDMNPRPDYEPDPNCSGSRTLAARC